MAVSLIDVVQQKAYAFDFDGNLLHMPTYVYVRKNYAIDAKHYPVEIKIPHTTWDNNTTDTFRDGYTVTADTFRDFRDDDLLVEEVKVATEGPHFQTFVNAVLRNDPVTIITSRGQSAEALRKALLIFSDGGLTSEQLANVSIHPVNSRKWQAQAVFNGVCSPRIFHIDSPTRKTIAMGMFIRSLDPDLNWKVGFSDDTQSNRVRMAAYFQSGEMSIPIEGYVFDEFGERNKC